MGNLTRDFVSQENRNYKFKFGHMLASSLSGFVCGVVVATIIWMTTFKYFQEWLASGMVG